MRAVLLSLPSPGDSPQPKIAGKSLAQRQLLFAKEAGCEMAVLHGGGAGEQAIALRHMAERLGMRFQTVSNAHALPGIIGSGDSMLVVQPGLLPEAREALDLIAAEGDRALVVSSGPGTSAGLERIDLDRAWGGVLTMPGSWLGRLAALPEDVAPHAALLRIALQHRLPEARLDDAILDAGRWTVLTSAESAGAREQGWLREHVGDAKAFAPSRWLARLVLLKGAHALLERAWTLPLALTSFAILLLGGVASAWLEKPVLGFALIALGVPVLECALGLRRLAIAPFGAIRRLPWLRHAIDAGLLFAGVAAIDGLWFRAAFPPFALVAGLIVLDRMYADHLLDAVGDRGLVAAAIAILSAIAMPELALVLVASAILLAVLIPRAPKRG
ncbi:MAG: hypothetical protein WBA68_11325 [Alteraurantiacibacter sp.]